MLIDLQVHSTYSDGYLTPSELAKFLHSNGVRVAALTDHNTIGGLGEFREACKKHQIKTIPGLELYVKLNGKKFNLLWFNFNEESPELHKLLRDSQARRRGRARKILNKLKSIGFAINPEKILDKYNHYIPVNHVVDNLWASSQNKLKIKKELNNPSPREEEIIRAFFYNKDIGRMEESYMNIERVIKLRKKIGGQLVLNHPGKYGHITRAFLEKLKKMGIDGIELLSPHHSVGFTMYIQFIADELGFITTGGSDFHKFESRKTGLTHSWQYFKIEIDKLKGVKKII